MRYQAPLHTSSISAPTRDIPVGDDGIVDLADDAPQVEHDYLRRAGCQLVADESAHASAAAPSADDNGEDADGDASAKVKPKN